jgi:KDO2-lipid IV(A) lauroyltransferase
MFSYIYYRIGEALALSMPLKTGYKLAIFLSNLRYFFAFGDRKIVKENLKAIFPQKSDKEIAGISKKMFNNFAKYLVDFFNFRKLNADYIKDNVKFINLEYIDEALRLGRGVILVTAHLGNWELGGVVLPSRGYSLMSVALPHKSKKVDDFFNKQREEKGLKIYPLGSAVKECLRALKKNQIIALVGDRDFTGGSRIVKLFGKPSVIPEGPAVFSLRTNAVIIPGFMLRNNDDTFSLVFEKPLTSGVSKDRDTDIENIMSQYVACFQDYIRNYPDQWYMFRRFWKE